MMRCWPKRFDQSAFLALAGLVAGATGCRVAGPSCPATPQVSGRVLAADTRQPLAGVKVVRVVRGQSPAAAASLKGAQLLQQRPPVRTDAAGCFVFPSIRYATLFHRANGSSLKLSFQAAHYVSLQTNFTTVPISDPLLEGTPLIQAGDVLLTPLSPNEPHEK